MASGALDTHDGKPQTVLTDPEEIAIAARARQKNVANPDRPRKHFDRILSDFFDGVPLEGRYLDMGPGHYDLGEMIRSSGGVCVGLDFDPAVIELGRHKRFETIEMRIQDLVDHPLDDRFDGIFNKFTLNAFWYWADPARHETLIDAIMSMMAPKAWGWFGPWNGVPKRIELTPVQIGDTLALQRRLFEDRGYRTLELTGAQSRYYGIHGAVANHRVFYRNLSWTPKDPSLGVAKEDPKP
jgi:hypothetical protein